VEFTPLVTVIRELAWPVVALALAPFVIWRLGDIARLHEVIKKGDEFVKNIENIINAARAAEKAGESIKNVSDEIRKTTGSVELLKKQTQDLSTLLQEQAIQKIYESADTPPRKEVEAIQSEKEFQPEHDMSSEDLYKGMQSAWDELNDVVKAKLQSIDKKFDARSLRIAVAPLTDGRCSVPLAKTDVEFLSNLQSQYSRFRSLKATTEEWLTPEIYSDFKARVAVAKKLIDQTA